MKRELTCIKPFWEILKNVMKFSTRKPSEPIPILNDGYVDGIEKIEWIRRWKMSAMRSDKCVLFLGIRKYLYCRRQFSRHRLRRTLCRTVLCRIVSSASFLYKAHKNKTTWPKWCPPIGCIHSMFTSKFLTFWRTSSRRLPSTHPNNAMASVSVYVITFLPLARAHTQTHTRLDRCIGWWWFGGNGFACGESMSRYVCVRVRLCYAFVVLHLQWDPLFFFVFIFFVFDFVI